MSPGHQATGGSLGSASLASERHRVAHPVLWLQKIAAMVAAASCHVVPVSHSAIDGHIALCPSISVGSLQGERIVTNALISTRRFVTFAVARKTWKQGTYYDLHQQSYSRSDAWVSLNAFQWSLLIRCAKTPSYVLKSKHSNACEVFVCSRESTEIPSPDATARTHQNLTRTLTIHFPGDKE